MNRSLEQCLYNHQNDVNGFYAAIDSYRAGEDAYWDDALASWVIVGYEACKEALKNPLLTRSRLDLPQGRMADVVEVVQRILSEQMMFQQPGEELSACRKHWIGNLHKGIEGDLSNTLVKEVDDALDQFQDRNEIEAYSELLQPFASKVIAGRMSISEEERQLLYPLIIRYVKFLDGKLSLQEEYESAMLSIVKLYTFCAGKFKERVPRGQDHKNWLSNYMLTLVAGHESVAYLLGTIFIHTQDRFRDEVLRPDNHANFINESLRYDSPVQLIGRVARSEITIGRHKVKPSQKVAIHVGAANRDPQYFENADVFDPFRTAPPPISFGVGECQCIGRSLSLHGASVFLSGLSERGQWLDIDQESVVWNNGLAGRGYGRLPAKLVDI